MLLHGMTRGLSRLLRHCYINDPIRTAIDRGCDSDMDGPAKHSPLALANTFVERYGGTSGITHMKLQKLCYYAHGWWLAFDDRPFLTERPEVWKFGPVFNSLYSALSHHGSRPIMSPERARFDQAATTINDQRFLDLVDWIWNRYGHHSAMTLSDMTHAPGTPWRNVAERHRFQVPKHFELPDEDVAAHFKAAAEKLQPA